MPLDLVTWNIFRHFLLAWSISIEKSIANLIGAPLYVTSCFSLAAFKILSLGITGTTIKDTWTKSRVRVEVGDRLTLR